MIDWANVAVNSLWILGLAVILAALGHHDWLAYRTRVRLRELFTTPSWRRPGLLGMLLVCLGLMLASWVRWQGVLWAALKLWYGWQFAKAGRAK